MTSQEYPWQDQSPSSNIFLNGPFLNGLLTKPLKPVKVVFHLVLVHLRTPSEPF